MAPAPASASASASAGAGKDLRPAGTGETVSVAPAPASATSVISVTSAGADGALSPASDRCEDVTVAGWDGAVSVPARGGAETTNGVASIASATPHAANPSARRSETRRDQVSVPTTKAPC